MRRRGEVITYVRVADRLVRLEQPAVGPRYDAFHVMGAAVAGWMLGLLVLAAACVK
jgi:hypothetical protein